MTPKEKTQDLLNKFDTLQDAILCVEEIMTQERIVRNYGGNYWQEVLTHLKEML
jgi:hypothetical protein